MLATWGYPTAVGDRGFLARKCSTEDSEKTKKGQLGGGFILIFFPPATCPLTPLRVDTQQSQSYSYYRYLKEDDHE